MTDVPLKKKTPDEIEILLQREAAGVPMDSTEQLIALALKLDERMKGNKSFCKIKRREADAIRSFVGEILVDDNVFRGRSTPTD